MGPPFSLIFLSRAPHSDYCLFSNNRTQQYPLYKRDAIQNNQIVVPPIWCLSNLVLVKKEKLFLFLSFMFFPRFSLSFRHDHLEHLEILTIFLILARSPDQHKNNELRMDQIAPAQPAPQIFENFRFFGDFRVRCLLRFSFFC